MTESEIISGSRTRYLGKRVVLYDTIDSTNSAGKELAQKGAPEGTLLLAEEQSAGRGRLGRTWESAKGKNLTFSIILRPRVAAGQMGLLSLLAGVAVCETLRADYRLDAACKWPNDILLGEKKVCGILSESLLLGEAVTAAVVGIGLNVNQQAFGPELASSATSVLSFLGREVDRTELLCALLGRMEPLYDLFQHGETAAIIERWSAASGMIGRPLRVTDGRTPVEGIARGLAPDGALLLDTAAGLLALYAGDVTLREP